MKPERARWSATATRAAALLALATFDCGESTRHAAGLESGDRRRNRATLSVEAFLVRIDELTGEPLAYLGYAGERWPSCRTFPI